MIFARQGLMGTREFSWNGLQNRLLAWKGRYLKAGCWTSSR